MDRPRAAAAACFTRIRWLRQATYAKAISGAGARSGKAVCQTCHWQQGPAWGLTAGQTGASGSREAGGPSASRKRAGTRQKLRAEGEGCDARSRNRQVCMGAERRGRGRRAYGPSGCWRAADHSMAWAFSSAAIKGGQSHAASYRDKHTQVDSGGAVAAPKLVPKLRPWSCIPCSCHSSDVTSAACAWTPLHNMHDV